MNTEDSEFARLEHEALLRASQPEQPSKSGELSDDECRDIYNAAMYLPNRNIVSVMRYIIAHTVAQPVQERLAELHLYEEINQYYAKCNAGAENLRDWVAERMDIELEQPASQSELQETFAQGMSCRPASVQRTWVGLTDAEAESAIDEVGGFAFGLDDGNVSNAAVVLYAKAIETKLKEKNNG